MINGFTEFMPQMIAHGRGGHIVSTSSLGAEVVGRPQMAIYASSKAAVCHFCEAVKPELAEHDIGVSVLLPGPVKSNIHETIDNRPVHLRQGSGFQASEEKLSRRIIAEEWMEATEVGNMVADGILANATYIVTHGAFKDAMRERCKAVLDATPDTREEIGRFDNYRED